MKLNCTIKIFFILSLLHLIQNQVFAQDRRFGGGLVFGLTASQINGDAAAGYHKVGLNLGVRGTIKLTERWLLSLDLLFNQRGSRTTEAETIFMRRVHLQYLEIPIMVRYADWRDETKGFYRVYAAAGVGYSRLFSYSLNDYAQTAFRFSQDFRPNEISVMGEFGFRSSEHWAYSLRFSRALLPLTAATPTAQSGIYDNWWSYFLAVSAHYDF
jgi:hypothetical protein